MNSLVASVNEAPIAKKWYGGELTVSGVPGVVIVVNEHGLVHAPSIIVRGMFVSQEE